MIIMSNSEMRKLQRLVQVLLWISIFITAIPAFAPGTAAYAVTVPKLEAHTGRLTTDGETRVFVTGTVSVSGGQDIVVLDADGDRELARQEMDKEDGEGSFLLWIPQDAVNEDGQTEFRVRSKQAKGLAASKPVRVSIRESHRKKTQTIDCPAKVTLTNLRKKGTIKASVSSGKKLTFTSSNSRVVTVSKKGKIRRIKNGKATITVRAEGDDKYRPAEATIAVTSRKSTRKEQIDAAVDWAVMIAKDNSFSYGTGAGAHHFGCYFCGTNYGPRKYMKPSKRYRKTYCCNPFISAAYAHGAKHPKMLEGCRHAYGIGMKKEEFYRFGCWKCVGKPAYRKLQKGDVLVKYNHVIMYIGRHRIVEATGGTWKASSIAVRHLSRSRYRQFGFVMRYKGY